jgi:hypothetical protein
MPDRAMVMWPRAVAGLWGWFFQIISGVAESRVVGKSTIGDGFVESFGRRGAEGGRSVEN